MNRKQKNCAILIPALITIVIYVLVNNYGVKINYIKFLELFITVFSILIGFLLTVSTLLHSISNPKFEFIKKSDGGPPMFKDLKNSIFTGILSIIMSLFVFLLEDSLKVGCYNIFIYIVIWFNLISFITCFYFIKSFLEIILDE